MSGEGRGTMAIVAEILAIGVIGAVAGALFGMLTFRG
jgi:hypothetical protein